MNVYQRVKVYDAPYYPEGWDIWAEIDGVETHLSHNEVASSLLICMTEEEAERCDGLERLLLADGRVAIVQSIDLDFLPDPIPNDNNPSN